jgi:hypothetical protein
MTAEDARPSATCSSNPTADCRLPPATPVRLQLSRRAGFRLQQHSLAVNGLPTVNVARPGKWGNPHIAIRTWYHGPIPSLGLPPFEAATAAEADEEGARIAVALFRHDWDQVMTAPSYGRARAQLDELRGRNIACWCGLDAPWCHGDILLDLANRPRCEEVAPAAEGGT